MDLRDAVVLRRHIPVCDALDARHHLRADHAEVVGATPQHHLGLLRVHQLRRLPALAVGQLEHRVLTPPDSEPPPLDDRQRLGQVELLRAADDAHERGRLLVVEVVVVEGLRRAASAAQVQREFDGGVVDLNRGCVVGGGVDLHRGVVDLHRGVVDLH